MKIIEAAAIKIFEPWTGFMHIKSMIAVGADSLQWIDDLVPSSQLVPQSISRSIVNVASDSGHEFPPPGT